MGNCFSVRGESTGTGTDPGVASLRAGLAREGTFPGVPGLSPVVGPRLTVPQDQFHFLVCIRVFVLPVLALL